MVSLLNTEPSARPSKWRARWHAFRNPIHEEKARVLKERWDSLPKELQTDNQISGRHLTHCGFTLGASYCSFHCTHCYLPKNANAIPIPSLLQNTCFLLMDRIPKSVPARAPVRLAFDWLVGRE